MPRPALFTVDELLDAAAALLAADGPAAVTMSAVARAAGAPSGSMYHRFPTRAALCGELWIRTEERFHAGLTAALATSADPQDRCVAAARFTVQWCRDHPVEAQVLLTGADALGAADWPDELTSRRRRLHRALRGALAGMPARPGSGQRGGDRHPVCGCTQAPHRGTGHPRERGPDRRALRAGTYTC